MYILCVCCVHKCVYIGFVNSALVKQVLPGPTADHLVYVCGPPPMMNAISGPKTPNYEQGEVSGVLKELGYTSDMVYKF